jgi:uncharacterized protein YqeY
MELVERIDQDLKTAMRGGDKLALSVLRMLKSDLKYKQIELNRDLSEDDCVGVLAAAAKKRRDAIAGFEKGGREDLVKQEKSELELINKYLPEQISDDELAKLVDEVIAETSAATPADLGLVMKNIMPKLKGRVDGRKVNELVLNKLR